MSKSPDCDLARRFVQAMAVRLLEQQDPETLATKLSRRAYSVPHPERRLFADVLSAVAELSDPAAPGRFLRH